MFKNYLKVAIRNLLKQKFYTAVNTGGLSLGIAAALLILFFIRFEKSFDNFHERGNDIYRVSIIHEHEGVVEYDSPVFVPPIGPTLAADFPEVENFVRFSTLRSDYFYNNGKPVKVNRISHVDSTLFDVFSFKLLRGNPETALKDPYSIVVTASTAKKIFGNQDPLDKTLTTNNDDIYKVTGVIADPPVNSHLQFNLLISFSTLYEEPGRFMGWNGGNQYISYVLLKPHTSSIDLEAKLGDFMWRYMNEDYAAINWKNTAYLQPLHDIHLEYGDTTGASYSAIIMMSVFAGLILLVAAANFINLTTASASRRAREIGIRKVMGANRRGLIKQFLAESLVLSFLSMFVALFLLELTMPILKDMLGRDIDFHGILDWSTFVGIIGITIIVGLAAGSYPAFVLSSFQPVNSMTLKSRGKERGLQRHLLVIFQFSVAAILVVSTLFIHKQLSFMTNHNPGFDKDNLLVIPLTEKNPTMNLDLVKTELRRIRDVESVTASSQIPLWGLTSNGYQPEGVASPIMIHVLDVDDEFVNAYGLALVSGRNFSSEMLTDDNAYLINESLAKRLSWNDPMGRTIARNGDHTVIGVVKDFYYAPLYNHIEPLIITNRGKSSQASYLSVKYRKGRGAAVLERISKVWPVITDSAPFEYWFLDDGFKQLYSAEQKKQMLVLFSSGIALLIALIGLYSLTSYMAERRTKEIGIRKVLGASISQIIGMLSKDYILAIAVANLIALPVTWYFLSSWLQNFALRIALGIEYFITVAIFLLIIGLATIIVRTIKTAHTNPVVSLRYE